MPLTLYMENLSPPSRAVMMTIEALGISVEYVTVNLAKKEHLKPEFLKKNPLHTVPTLVDESTIICDSHAIMAYLVPKYSRDDSLYPKDLKKRAMVDQKLHFDTGFLFNHVRLFVKKCYAGRCKIVEDYEKDFITLGYNFLETFLNETPYVAGDTLTIADFSAITSVKGMDILVPIDETVYPKLANWMRKMEALSYYKKVNDVGMKDLIDFITSLSDVIVKT
ncbi:glutathione S-transferase 1-like [Coccinella septempunctata]|uniref:glutathione S-transferase 1-like n=1 Tax=Coccinella septempunctata TaxID=41139 RepID=UPI001D096E8D|nr:glutathione S-transferase 1-like [Coccinella septempunctata]XP_044766832.1 glutathione S-transferase 1-like [Coccinella septempunctata]XP_044766833.1 glutathione S-transferase 1-like [Coccinella septempunctata]